MSGNYYIEVKIKNGILLKLMQSRGHKSVLSLSKAIDGVNYHWLMSLANLKLNNPRHEKTMELLALVGDYFGTSGESLMPPELLDGGLTQNVSGRFVDFGDIHALENLSEVTPELDYFGKELKQSVDDSLEFLSEKDRDIIKLIFWEGKTLEQVAKKYNVTRTRIRQRKEKAILKLRKRLDKNQMMGYFEVMQ